jgi:kinesin family protein 2/24
VSSRSHAICQILVKKKGTEIGKLTLVDLAGSERAQDT